MKQLRRIILFAIFLSGILSINQHLNAQTPADRVTAPIDDRLTVKRPGNIHPLARPEFDAGQVSPQQPMQRMILVLQPDPAQERALEALLAAQQDPQSPQYHRWLTPETFGKMFGVSDRDLEQVTAWLTGHGFEVEPAPSGRRQLVFSGTAAQVEAAFHTQIHAYHVNGETHYANSTDPEIPLALAAVVQGVASLHDFYSVAMHQGPLATKLMPLARPAPEYSSGGTNYIAPADFATIYDVAALYSSSVNGAGESIAIVGRTNFTLADITKFRSTFGLPANNPTVVLNGPNPGIVSSDEQTEAELDVEWSGAVAVNASIQFVLSASTNTTDGAQLSAQYIVNQNLAPVMSSSFGLCEAAIGTSGNQFWNSLWQQAAGQGITVLIASGDSGAAGCDSPTANQAVSGRAVNGICSSPYSTCVGGTQFNDTSNASLYWAPASTSNYGSALSYIPELVWNASALSSGGSGLWASGGGASIIYPKPAWQTGLGVPPDGQRDVPDVALNASLHDGYLFCLNGQIYLVGGTSAATPTFAALMSLAVQHAGARQGNANPNLYALAANQLNGGAAVFHDTTAGNNSVPGVSGFSAGPGFDLATGLGSVDAFVLVNNWSDATVPRSTPPGLQLNVSPPSVTLAPGAGATAQLSVTVSGGFSSLVSLSSSNLPLGLTANFGPPSLVPPGSGSSTLTLTAASTAAPGPYTIYLTAAGGGINQTVPLAVTIQSKCSYAINPTSAAPAAAGGNFTATVTTSNGCAWTASSAVNWINITSGASQTGNGTLYYSVLANSSTGSRSASILIAGLSLSVTQSGASSSVPPLNPPSATFGAAGGRASVTVTLPNPTATWTATSNASWITITSGASSNGGNKTVNYLVAANSGAQRTGYITIAGLAFIVSQAGSSCSYGISLGNMTATSGGFNGSAKISTSASSCQWSAASNVTWIAVTSGSPGTGPGTVDFFVANNPNSSARVGDLTVAGFTIQITEGSKGAVILGKPVH
jgi:pseudomonalisin